MSLLVPPVGFGAGRYIENVGGIITQSSFVTDLTLLGVPFGAPNADRVIIVALATATAGTTAKTFNSAEIAGSAATTLVTQSYDGADQAVTAIFGRAVAAGSSGTVRLIYSGNVQFHAIQVYRAVGVSLTATDTATASGAGASYTLDVNTLAGNCVVGAVSHVDGGGGVSWSGVSEVQAAVGIATHSTAYLQRASSAETPRAVSVSGSSADGAACAVSLPFN